MYADDDYAAANSRRSVSGVAVMVDDTVLAWKSSTQKYVTTATCEADCGTTCEADCGTLCDASKEALFIDYSQERFWCSFSRS